MQVKFNIYALLFLIITVLASCGKESDNGGKVNFDRKAFLKELAEKTILPAYGTLDERATAFQNALNDFEREKSGAKLLDLRTKFSELYLAWQSASLFEFGPADNVLLRSNMNTFPTSVSIIEANIERGNVNLDAASNLPAKGLPAMDYLLFGEASKNETEYAAFLGENKRLSYLKALTTDMLAKVKKVHNDWRSGYLNVFVESAGADAGSSLSLFVNQFNFDYELLKNPKIGIPAGVKTLGIPQPDRSEALYISRSGSYPLFSNRLALANLAFYRAVFSGTFGNQNLSLKAYLDAHNAKRGSILLSQAILEQFAKAENAVKILPGSIENSAIANDGKLLAAYEELQKAVVLLKTDMPSVLGVQITYQDADGD